MEEWSVSAGLTLGILAPRDLEEVLDIGDFGGHFGGGTPIEVGAGRSRGGFLGCWSAQQLVRW